MRSILFLSLLIFVSQISEAATPRMPSKPLPSNPGNIYLNGDTVTIPLPVNLTGMAATWQLRGDGPAALASGACPPVVPPSGEVKPAIPGITDSHAPRVSLGKLPIGWYRIDFQNVAGEAVGWTTAAVLAPLAAVPPLNSPVSLDMATTWFARRYGKDVSQQVANYANFATLAGANWVRDRSNWAEIEPTSGQFKEQTDYDLAATLQSEAGLRVLQTYHNTPAWATDKALDGDQGVKRLPRDLRNHYRYCLAMAKRFKGRIQAWEPWNEANHPPFGSHTTTEMSSLQKAAYLGYKAGDPEVTVSWNSFAGAGTEAQTANVLANEVWPYFETYNIHSYETPSRYLKVFATAREAASGRPIWLSECGQYLPSINPAPWGEISTENEWHFARFVAQSYASSLFSGVANHFFFVLGNYIEDGAQLGLLRQDHTPRPAFVAYAAVGRLLAGAQCLGRVSSTAPADNAAAAPQVYAFTAKPDGVDREVLVAWTNAEAGLPWPEVKIPADRIVSVIDYLGRDLGKTLPTTLRREPVFVLLAPKTASTLGLEAPPALAAWREGAVSPVVLQLLEPNTAINLEADAYVREPGSESEVTFAIYNFSDHSLAGSVVVESLPEGWKLDLDAKEVSTRPLEGGERRTFRGKLSIPAGGRSFLFADHLIKLRGEFGDAGRPTLAFRIAADPVKLTPTLFQPIPSVAVVEKWQEHVAPGGKATQRVAPAEGMEFEVQFGSGEAWNYPILTLNADEVPSDDKDGLLATIEWLEGEGDMVVQFVDGNGSIHFAGLPINKKSPAPQTAAALFNHTTWAPWSKSNVPTQFKPSDVRKVMIGVSGKSGTRARFVVRKLEWVRY